MVPHVIRYDESFEINAAQLVTLQRSFGHAFAWRHDQVTHRILAKVWDMSRAERIHKALKKLE